MKVRADKGQRHLASPLNRNEWPAYGLDVHAIKVYPWKRGKAVYVLKNQYCLAYFTPNLDVTFL